MEEIQNSRDQSLDLFYKATRHGNLKLYKQLMIDTGLKNPLLETEEEGLIHCLDLAIKHHHSALARVIHKVR